MADRSAVPHGSLLGRQLSMPSRVDEITDRLVTAIAIGEYLPGARLPVERELAGSLGVHSILHPRRLRLLALGNGTLR